MPLPVRPPVIDFRSLHEAATRVALRDAVSDTLSPMFALSHHGLEGEIKDLVSTLIHGRGVDVTQAGDAHEVPSCVSIEMESILPSSGVERLHRRLSNVVETLLVALLGLNTRRELVALLRRREIGNTTGGSGTEESRLQMLRIGGRESIRFYPHAGDGVLGAHVDMNMITLLWANGPGLEVVDPRADGVDPAFIRQVGIPSTTIAVDDDGADPLEKLGEAGWRTVDACWERGDFLVTIGDEWFRTFIDARTAIPLQVPNECASSPDIKATVPRVLCPVLHRVNRSLHSFKRKATGTQSSSPTKNRVDEGSGHEFLIDQQIIGGNTSATDLLSAAKQLDCEVPTHHPDGCDSPEMSFGPYWDEAGRFSLPFLARLVECEPFEDFGEAVSAERSNSINAGVEREGQEGEACESTNGPGQ